jgi:flavodoxin
MQSIIIYYSYSGNTQKVANILIELLETKGEAQQTELVGLNESKSFFGQCCRAFLRKKAALSPVNFDLSEFDLICFGTPVWAFGSAPAMNAYLDQCSGLEGKSVILFSTYGSGTGNEHCLNYMQDILAKKGAKKFNRFSIQQFKVNDKEFVLSKIKEIARLWPNG